MLHLDFLIRQKITFVQQLRDDKLNPYSSVSYKALFMLKLLVKSESFVIFWA